MKRFFAILLVLVMVFALAACGNDATPAASEAPAASSTPAESPAAPAAPAESSAPPASPAPPSTTASAVVPEAPEINVDDPFARDPYHIVYYNHIPSNVAMQCYEALVQIGEVWNFTVENQTANADSDFYITNLETILLMEPDGLIIDVTSELAARVSEICRSYDTPVIDVYNNAVDANGVAVIPCVIVDQFANGRTQMQFLIDNYKTFWGDIDTSEIAFLNVDWSQNQDIADRGIGAKELWDEVFPGQLFLYGDTGYDTISSDTGFSVANSILSANPDVAYWFITVNLEDTALGVARAVEALDIEDKCLITASGAAILPSEWDAGYEGSWIANFSVPPFFYAGTAAMGMLEIIDGKATMDTLWPEYLRPGDQCARYVAVADMMTRDNYKELMVLTAARFGVDIS